MLKRSREISIEKRHSACIVCEDISDHFPTYLDIDLNTNFSTDDVKINDEKRKYNKHVHHTLFEKSS